MESTEIFTIKARKCKRCGGILLSEFGLKHGMGHVCKRKYDSEHAPIDENQIILSDIADGNSLPPQKGDESR